MIFFLVLICFSFFLEGQDKQQTIPVAIYLNPSAHAAAHGGESHTTMVVHQSVIQSVEQRVQLIKSELSSAYQSIMGYLKAHKINILCYSAISAYVALLLFLLVERHALFKGYYWSVWCTQENGEMMYAQEYDALKTRLIKSIASYYINPNNPTDTIWPLIHFVDAVKKEETRLKRYIYIAKLIKKTPLTYILPGINDEEAQKMLHHLQQVYHIFTDWSAEFTWDTLMHQTA